MRVSVVYPTEAGESDATISAQSSGDHSRKAARLSRTT